MRFRLGRSALIASALGALACSGAGEASIDGWSDGQFARAARRVIPALGQGYCHELTQALIAAAGDPTDPVAPLTEQAIDGSACNAVERSYPLADSTHVPVCSDVEYATNPPSSGHHYALFPKYQVYDDAIPRGFWVHALEHGGVVFTYSCTDCGDEVSQAKTLIAATKPAAACCSAAGCASTETNQLLMTPDPGIPTRWAASSWGFTLTADCFEPSVFGDFLAAHRDNGAPELICENTYATDVTFPGLD